MGLAQVDQVLGRGDDSSPTGLWLIKRSGPDWVKKNPNVNLRAKNGSLMGIKQTFFSKTMHNSGGSKRIVVEDTAMLPEKLLVKPLCVFHQSFSRHLFF